MPSNFGVTIKDSRDAIKALNMFKDEYLLDFINTEEIDIRDYENGELPEDSTCRKFQQVQLFGNSEQLLHASKCLLIDRKH